MVVMTTRGYNFGAGPAMLPTEILQTAQSELLNWNNQGMSILEVGHRTEAFRALLQDTKAQLYSLLQIPKDYHVLFLGGATRTHFNLIPMNLLHTPGASAGYIESGTWSSSALLAGKSIAKVYSVASSKEKQYNQLPNVSEVVLKPNTRYVYFTPNETIEGVRFPHPPSVPVPLIADMTSCLLSEPIDVASYGLIFAGAQKNIANAGLTIVIIRDDILKTMKADLPPMFSYITQVEHDSLYATPPTFNCYIANLMLHWLKAKGGVSQIHQMNLEKARRLYHFIDNSSLYVNSIAPDARSIMNVCFSLKNQSLEASFLQAAEDQSLYGLKGHRSRLGCRASLYNAMPLAGVDALIEYMACFEKQNDKNAG